MKTFIIENDQTYHSVGYANGYVVIPFDHKLNGLSYDYLNYLIVVHGGLTFSHFVKELDWNEVSDCNPNDWVVGFDTHHFQDTLSDWPIEKVEKELLNLKNQLIKL